MPKVQKECLHHLYRIRKVLSMNDYTWMTCRVKRSEINACSERDIPVEISCIPGTSDLVRTLVLHKSKCYVHFKWCSVNVKKSKHVK